MKRTKEDRSSKIAFNFILCIRRISCLISLFTASLFAENHDFCSLVSPTKLESNEVWFKEYKIGEAFAQQKEYLEAIHSFKRAHILAPKESLNALSLEYAIVLCYYHLKEYEKLIQYFETHSLLYATSDFLAYEDLLHMVHFSYAWLKDIQKADIIGKQLALVSEQDPKKVELISALFDHNYDQVTVLSNELTHSDWATKLVRQFKEKQKSRVAAQWYNAILPGVGYYYLGQKKAALTAFLVNFFLIYGAIQVFRKKHYVLGAFVALFAFGWYAGGILGMDGATKEYNEIVYSTFANKVFYEHHLNPHEVLQYDF